MLNERNKANKAKKNKLIPATARPNFPEGQASDDTTPAENPHGTNSMGSGEPGHKRGGKKMKGAKPPIQGRLARTVKGMSSENKRKTAKRLMKKNLMSHTVYQDMGMLMAESLGLVSEEYNSNDELRGQLRGRGIATFRSDGTGPARTISSKERPTKPTPTKPTPTRKKIVVRKKKTTKKSRPPSNRSIAKRWQGPDGSEHGG